MKKIFPLIGFIFLISCHNMPGYYDKQKEAWAEERRAKQRAILNIGEESKLTIVPEELRQNEIGIPETDIYFINKTGKKITGIKFYLVLSDNFGGVVCKYRTYCRFNGIFQDPIDDNNYSLGTYTFYGFDTATRIKDKKIYQVAFDDGKIVNY